jgi:hypothetical protein
MLPAFDWNGGRLQLESLAGIVGIRIFRRMRMFKLFSLEPGLGAGQL